MREGYKKIFWGFIFITIHINLGKIEILPNFIGYLIIYYGVKKVNEDYNIKSFEQSSRCCFILVLMSLLSFISIFINNEVIINNIYFNLVWINTLNILEIIMIYKLLYGSCEVLKKNSDSLYNRYNKRIGVYLLLSTITAILYNIYMVFMSDILSLLMGILQLALIIWIILLIRNMYKVSENIQQI